LADFFLIVGQAFFRGVISRLFAQDRGCQDTFEFRRRLAALGAVGFVHNNCILTLGQVADLFRHKGNF
jgi:hypothetical protein